jgi:sodium ion-translocating decarboxylase beta subunit
MFEHIWKVAAEFIAESGFGQFYWGNAVMIGVGLLFIYLAIKRGFEPLLLVPIGFGILIGNVPYDSASTPVGAYDGPVDVERIDYYTTERTEWAGQTFEKWQLITNPVVGEALFHEPTAAGREKMEFNADLNELNDKLRAEGKPLEERKDLELLDFKAVMVDRTVRMELPSGAEIDPSTAVGLQPLIQGRHILVGQQKRNADGIRVLVPTPASPEQAQANDVKVTVDYPVIIPRGAQNPAHASPLWTIARGIIWDFFPPLIFLGLGALTDFGPLLSNPRTIILGAAAQFGVFATVFGAMALGFSGPEAASIGIIGGADGPTAIYLCSKLSPDLLGAIALSAYSYMAMVPLIQPPIMLALTSKKERMIRMEMNTEAPLLLRVLFPIVGFLVTAFIANAALPLLGFLFFGNLMRECGVVDRLFKTAQSQFIDIVTILLGLSVGALTQASTFLKFDTLKIFLLGMVAFSVATAAGLLMAKLMNLFCKKKINPLIGSAGVSAVPMAARVSQMMAHRDDPHNFILMHAMGPNVAGVIGTAVAAGVLLSYYGH